MFGKVSLHQFIKDTGDDIDVVYDGYEYTFDDALEWYHSQIKLPKRATKHSAGYDFYCPFDVKLRPHDKLIIPTGVRCKIPGNHCMLIAPRSSAGIKHGIVLQNTVGIIDSDYYQADNEGHIMIALKNTTKDTVEFKMGDRIAQCIILPYFSFPGETFEGERTGGIGSTGK